MENNILNINRDNHKRCTEFQRNEDLEKLLTIINNILRCADKRVISNNLLSGSDFPIVFVMGPLRSGTTLFMQWLAYNKIVAYPSNLLSRFYEAPLTGAYIQLLLTDPRYNFRNEILDFNQPISFNSENGKTRGALEPNEFWYFWRRFLPHSEIDWMSDDDLMIYSDHKELVKELAALTRIFQKPFALKGMILNYNIPFLNRIFEKGLFIQIKRDDVLNVASIMDARIRQKGSIDAWYSFKIPEYQQLRKYEPIAQCSGQLSYINQAISKGMASVREDRKIFVSFEEFCKRPQNIFCKLCEKLDLKDKLGEYHGPDKFTQKRKIELAKRHQIEDALRLFT